MMIHTLRLFISSLLIAVLVSCSQQSADKAPPTVSLSADQTNLTDAGSITLIAEASDDKGVSKVEFYKGEIKLGEDSSNPYTLKVDLSADNNGDNSFTAKAFDAAGKNTTSSPVNVSVDIDNVPPKVSLKASSSNLSSAGNITLNASVSDNKGVVKVEFYQGQAKLGEDTTSNDGFTQVVTVNAEQNGSLKYFAKAFDAKGNSASSAEVSVSVDIDVTKPTISLSADKTSVTSAGPALLTAIASDNKGIARVEFFEGDIKLGEDIATPFSFEANYNATHNGAHTYSAKAFDGAGNSAESQAITINVNIDETSPTVSLASEKEVVSTVGNITLTATASDNVGVSKVEFYRGDTKLGQKLSAPFSWTVGLSDADNGTVAFSAKAYDDKNNLAISNTVSVLVDIDVTPPTVSLEASNTVVTSTAFITLTATANDNKGISKVEFYSGETKVGEDLSGPFTLDMAFTEGNNGTRSYTAKAFDTSGNATISNVVVVKVDIDSTAPTINLTSTSTNITAAETIILNAAANDNRAVTRVDFFDGNDKIGEDETSPYSLDVELTDSNNGIRTYSARAFDAAGNSAVSSQVLVTVDIDAIPPTVSLSSLYTNVTEVDTLTLSASASDNKSISKVEFYEDNAKLGEDLTSPYSFSITYTSASIGSHSYTAKAIDASNNTASSTAVNVTVSSLSLAQLSLGNWHSCGLTSGGKAYCWGSNSSGQVGNSSNTNTNKASAVTMPSGITFSQISAGGDHTCAIGSNQRAYCWGQGSNGQIGNGSIGAPNTPTLVSLPNGVSGFSEVSAGDISTCGLGLDGRVYCWGSNSFGRLGVSTATSSSSTPVAATLPAGVSSFSKLASGTSRYMCAYASDSQWYCWGYNNHSNLGNGTSTSTTDGIPVAVTMPSGVTFSSISIRSDTSLGFSSSCTLGSNAKTYCWGGLQGTSTPSELNTTSLPSGVGLTSTSVGGLFICGLGSDGKAYCRGDNEYGQLGSGSNTHSGSSFVAVSSGAVTFSNVVSGNRHSCAVGSDSSMYCWGLGTGGQLGNNASVNSNVPVKVMF